MTRIRQFVLGLYMTLVGPAIVSAETALVAVAANFRLTAENLASTFQSHHNHIIRISSASTGKLYAQIQHGAPFDLFLSADESHAKKLVADSSALADSYYAYAEGKLALWSLQRDMRDIDLKTYLSACSHIALANPETAPYGIAANSTLNSLGFVSQHKANIVTGESVAQAFQFVASGNADCGLVALSQVRQWRGKNGFVATLPAHYYAPIRQAAVLLNHGRNNEAAKAFLGFLGTDIAMNMIRQDGYDIPGDSTDP